MKQIKDKIDSVLQNVYHTTAENADISALYQAVSSAALGCIYDKWKQTQASQERNRRAAYLSAEFLIGRMVFNNLYHLDLLDSVERYFKAHGRSISELEEIEDAALGNGGLGRLAACFLDSASTLGKSMIGYGIRYKYGLFKQKIEHGKQTELPDDWQRFGDPWTIRRDDLRFPITIGGKTLYAVAYDTPIIPYGNGCINTLRLFECESDKKFDLDKWNEQDYTAAVQKDIEAKSIHMVLYPNDTKPEGKKLRLAQEYFFSCAAIQDMLYAYNNNFGENYKDFYKYYAIQLNDTHPVLAIPILINELTKRGISFNDAFGIAQKTFSYTNHTVMAEALEKWDKALLKEMLPEAYKIIELIDKQLTIYLTKDNAPKNVIKKMSIIENDTVHMARLAVFVCHTTNGVAQIHTEILKSNTMHNWYIRFPKRFQNKTNGITPRRWLALANPKLSELITATIGDDWKKDLSKLKNLEPYARDHDFIKKFTEIKRQNKQNLCDYIKKHENVSLNANSIFDIQIKRLHEYKRQLLNALSALYLYFGIKDGKVKLSTPATILFGAKAASGYHRAKGIIQLICEIEKLIRSDSEVSKHLAVHFVENYNVSYAEKLVVAADISEQISTAGTEASGTGNMKLMLNGTVTLGTYDGANVEIVRKAGIENNYIFGARVEEIEKISDKYDPKSIYRNNKELKRVLDALVDGTLSDSGSGIFKELYDSLLEGASWHKADHYFVLHDFDDYIKTKLKCFADYEKHEEFAAKSIMNMANAGYFSSDRTIAEYCADIWNI